MSSSVPGPPQRSARGNHSTPTDRNRPLARITGTVYGGGRRITGPVDRAEGLVSGTPEFRYRDDAPAEHLNGQVQSPEVRRDLLTGEGRVLGFAVTGSAWRPNGVVTGTEGASARRNPTLRGEPAPAARRSAADRPSERAQAPVSRVTGSSGNYADGVLITYSGGARG